MVQSLELQVCFDTAANCIHALSDSWVVRDLPFHYTHHCIERTDWHTYVCTNGTQFAQLYIFNDDRDNTVYGSAPREITLVRDEDSTSELTLNFPPLNGFRYHALVIIGKSYTLHFPHATPPNLRLETMNFQRGEAVQLGIC